MIEEMIWLAILISLAGGVAESDGSDRVGTVPLGSNKVEARKSTARHHRRHRRKGTSMAPAVPNKTKTGNAKQSKGGGVQPGTQSSRTIFYGGSKGGSKKGGGKGRSKRGKKGS